jgi:hypothetical protein
VTKGKSILLMLAALLSVLVPLQPGAGTSRAIAAFSYYSYFAEGYTGANFATFLCACNPDTADTVAKVTYYIKGEGGSASSEVTEEYLVAAQSRITVNLVDVVGAGREVSMRVSSTNPSLAAERPMYFNYAGVWTGGSCVVGARSLSKDVYFAEGYTGPGFDEYICVLNPNDAAADLTFLFQTQEAGEVMRHGQVAPNSRATFMVNELLGPDYQASLHLQSTRQIVAERPMYFSYLGTANHNWPGGHCVMGLNVPARSYDFAEGTTRDGFEEWLCIQNPNSAEITVRAAYRFGPGQGEPLEKDYTVPAKSRQTILVEDEVGPGLDVSCRLSCEGYDFVAERPMYFLYHNWCTGGSCVMGAPNLATRWIFAEGCTSLMFDEWLCVFNPGPDPVTVDLRYFTDAGQVIDRTHLVGGYQRLTVSVNDDAGSDLNVSVQVTAGGPGVLVERPMYFLYDWQWPGGSCVVGLPSI